MSIGEYAPYWSGVVVILVVLWELRYGRLIRRLLLVLLEEDTPKDKHVRELWHWLRERFRHTTTYSDDL
jgi:hypothetical protein